MPGVLHGRCQLRQTVHTPTTTNVLWVARLMGMYLRLAGPAFPKAVCPECEHQCLAGNLKMTMPIAAATTQVAWGYALSPDGYRMGNASTLVADMLQWSGNYLTLCQNGTSYAVQVGC